MNGDTVFIGYGGSLFANVMGCSRNEVAFIELLGADVQR